MVDHSLNWLGAAPTVAKSSSGSHLSAAEAKLISDFMVRRFADKNGKLSWSSHMIDTALEVTAKSIEGPPEPFVF